MNFIKKLTTLALALTLSAAALVMPASAAENLVQGIGFVNATSLRLRSGPEETASILASANNNECVVVLGKSGQWYQVNYNLQVGYMHESYLDVLTKENAELGYGSVNASGVNLRSGPGTSYDKVTTVSLSSEVQAAAKQDGWTFVSVDGKFGWINSDFLSTTRPAS